MHQATGLKFKGVSPNTVRRRALGARPQASLRLVFGMLATVETVLSQGTAATTLDQSDLLTRLAAVEAENGDLCPPRLGTIDLHSRIMLAENQVRADPDGPLRGRKGVESLNRLLFDRLAIRPSRNLKDPCNLLPSAILERKQGYCVGIAALYVALAGRFGLPVFAVATPSHVFLRYDDGETRINIETQEAGASVPDGRYIDEQKIPARALAQGIFMRNLTDDELLAQVHNNLGVIFSEKGMYERAAGEYTRALSLDPRQPAACYNHGNDLLHLGQFRRAARLFTRSLKLYPSDVWALNNRGLAYKRLGKVGKARRNFERALEIDPAFETARANLGALGPD